MVLYTRRVEILQPASLREAIETCKKLGLLFDEFIGKLLKVWLSIEYVHSHDFWRRRFFAGNEKHPEQVMGKLITTYAPAYIYFAQPLEDDKTPIDIIALDRRCFDGAMELIRQTGWEISAKVLSLENFPENVIVEGFSGVDYSAMVEQAMGFDIPLSRKDALSLPSNTSRYFSVTFATNYPIERGPRLTTIGVERDRLALNIMGENPISEPLTESNQVEFIRQVSFLLSTLYTDTEKVCTRRL